MEPNIQNPSQPFKATGATISSGAATAGQTVKDKVSEVAHAVRDEVTERGAEIMDQAKQKVSDAYEQTSKGVTVQYEKALDYGRENPGKTTLIAFGVGVGVGVLLVSGLSSSRRRVGSNLS